MEIKEPMGMSQVDDAAEVAIRDLAVRMAQEQDVHVDRAEQAIRNLISRGLIELRAS